MTETMTTAQMIAAAEANLELLEDEVNEALDRNDAIAFRALGAEYHDTRRLILELEALR
jgi:hypothetical protein